MIRSSIAVADFNGDGKIDIAVVNRTVGHNITFMLGNGAGLVELKFPYAQQAPVMACLYARWAISTATESLYCSLNTASSGRL